MARWVKSLKAGQVVPGATLFDREGGLVATIAANHDSTHPQRCWGIEVRRGDTGGLEWVATATSLALPRTLGAAFKATTEAGTTLGETLVWLAGGALAVLGVGSLITRRM
jgi:hypothetical protein